MAYEYKNGNKYPVDCTFSGGLGTIRIPPDTYVPTMEQEAEGITAQMFKDYVKLKWLSPTKPQDRRSLLESSGLDVPQDLIARTAHLPEFAGPAEAVVAIAPETPKEDESVQVFSLEESLLTVDELAVATLGKAPQSPAPKAKSAAAEPTATPIQPEGELITLEDVNSLKSDLDKTDRADPKEVAEKLAKVAAASCSSGLPTREEIAASKKIDNREELRKPRKV